MSVTLFGDPVISSSAECTVARTRSRSLCRDLIKRWHSMLPIAPPGFRFAFVAFAPNGEIIACALWGRPVARLEDQINTLELTRMAFGPFVPKNFGSWMLEQMRSYIRENAPGIKRLISYQDADIHRGGVYMADHWHKIYEKRLEHTWKNRPGRLGTERKHKIKWERLP